MKTLIENLLIEKEDIVRLAPSQLLYNEKEPANYIYCLKEGVVVTYKQHSKLGKLWLSFAKPNQILGISALQKPYYEHTTKALGYVDVLKISVASVQKLVEQDPLFKLNLMQAICKEINQTEQKGIDSYNKTAKQKIAFLILELFKSIIDYAIEPEMLPISRDFLVEFAGVSASKLEKILQDLEQAKLIELQLNSIKILNPPALQLLYKS